MGPPIGEPSICFISLLLTKNTHSLVNFNCNVLNINFLTEGLIYLQT